jgi:hypothetical protein
MKKWIWLFVAFMLALLGPASAQNLIAGCPEDKDLMWCLKLKSDSTMIPVGPPQDDTWLVFRNEAMIEYCNRLPPRHGWPARRDRAN